MILILAWAIIMTITLGTLVVILLNLKKKHDLDISEKENEIRDMDNEIKDMDDKLQKKQSKAYQIGANTTSGDYTEILGDFAILPKYDQIITLSTSSKKPSLDLIGINSESLDFLEIKKKGASLSPGENHVRRLVEEKKVSYKVFDVDLPNNFSIKEREQKKSKSKESILKKSKPKLTREERYEKKELQKIEAKKDHPTAYEPWTISNDEFLKNYWNDESNKQSRDEKIQELCKKFDRSSGGIKSRLKKLGLD